MAFASDYVKRKTMRHPQVSLTRSGGSEMDMRRLTRSKTSFFAGCARIMDNSVSFPISLQVSMKE